MHEESDTTTTKLDKADDSNNCSNSDAEVEVWSGGKRKMT